MPRFGAFAALAGLLTLGAAPQPEILVFAAASLTESLQDIGKAYSAKTGTKVVYSFGPSNDLQRQISAGAPADVFFSADTPKMDALEQAGLVKKADRSEFLSNVLVVVVPADSTTKITSAKDLAALPRIALADPAAVPVGVYAKKWLESEGVWNQVASKVVPALDVRAALAAVASGSVSAGVVYATDAATSKGVRLAFTVANGPPITYSVAALAGSKRSAEAQAFVKFLESNEAKTVFQKRGFRILGAP
jgi:molybdate transport system substrate-binding protein